MIKTLGHLVESVKFAEEQEMISRAELTLVDNSLKGSSLRGDLLRDDLLRDSPPRNIAASPSLLPPLERLNHNIIFNDKNIGYGQANNQVIMTTDCEYQLVLNPDAYRAKDYLSVGLRYLMFVRSAWIFFSRHGWKWF